MTDTVYLLEFDAISRLPGVRENWVTLEKGYEEHGIAVAGGFVYWLEALLIGEGPEEHQHFHIGRVRRDGTEKIEEWHLLPQGDTRPPFNAEGLGLATDGSYLYYVVNAKAIGRVRIDGEEDKPEFIEVGFFGGPGVGRTAQLAVTRDYVYWMEESEVQRAKKDTRIPVPWRGGEEEYLPVCVAANSTEVFILQTRNEEQARIIRASETDSSKEVLVPELAGAEPGNSDFISLAASTEFVYFGIEKFTGRVSLESGIPETKWIVGYPEDEFSAWGGWAAIGSFKLGKGGQSSIEADRIQVVGKTIVPAIKFA